MAPNSRVVGAVWADPSPKPQRPKAANSWNPSNAKKKSDRKKKREGFYQDDRPPAILKYDMALSRKRLEVEGFHPLVTSLTQKELLQEWARLGAHIEAPFGPFYSDSRQLTRAPLLYRCQFMDETFKKEDLRSQDENCQIAAMLESGGVGGAIAEHIFLDGMKTVMNLASTSTQMWRATAMNANIWDFYSRNFRIQGHSGIFVVVTPQYAVGEFLEARDTDPYGLNVSNPFSSWFFRAMETESDVLTTVPMVHKRAGNIAPFWGRGTKDEVEASGREENMAPDCVKNNIEPRFLKAIRAIKNADEIWRLNQFQMGNVLRQYQPQSDYLATCLKALMAKIYEQRASIKVLYFHGTPMFDRRMLAIILRACPQVTMIGVYDCPLIHFGDVICLLDLINELNKDRRRKNLPQIEAFDFFPYYNKGKRYKERGAAAYGLTWAPQKLDIVQRGFYLVVLKAFLKAKVIGLKLLFSERHAFRDYLFRVPHPPLSVPTFLDALFRYGDALQDPAAENERKMALYDMLKPVRLGLCTSLQDDWPSYIMSRMGLHPVFCASCGYNMLQEFISTEGLRERLHQMICSGCILQYFLDTEEDHLRLEKRKCLDLLCPKWKKHVHNPDAPVPAKWKDILSLHSTSAARPDPPAHQIDARGHIYQPRYIVPLVRDKKLPQDSLRHLPTLYDLAESPKRHDLWGQFAVRCFHLDVYSRAVRLLDRQFPEKQKLENGWLPSFGSTRPDGARPDTIEEKQVPRQEDEYAQSHNFYTALRLHEKTAEKGW